MWAASPPCTRDWNISPHKRSREAPARIPYTHTHSVAHMSEMAIHIFKTGHTHNCPQPVHTQTHLSSMHTVRMHTASHSVCSTECMHTPAHSHRDVMGLGHPHLLSKDFGLSESHGKWGGYKNCGKVVGLWVVCQGRGYRDKAASIKRLGTMASRSQECP